MVMRAYDIGDRVRIGIPDKTDPDHENHGSHGTITDIISDDAGKTTGDNRDSEIYRIEIEDSRVVDVRKRDLRPPFDG